MDRREIKSLQHPLVKRLVKLRQDKCFRLQEGSALVIGLTLIRELSQYVEIKCIVADKRHLEPLFPDMIFSTSDIIKKIAGLASSEGVIAEVKLPTYQDLTHTKRLVVLDRITDPGNVGTILRTALALKWDGAFLTSGTADPFNEKAIRSAKGASFRLPLYQGSWSELTDLLATKKTYLADLEGTPISSVIKQEPLALILSNEAQGPSLEAKRIGSLITIPISSLAESLNVATAGAILMYKLNYE
jgi:TrmH family RNA methyltransferase